MRETSEPLLPTPSINDSNFCFPTSIGEVIAFVDDSILMECPDINHECDIEICIQYSICGKTRGGPAMYFGCIFDYLNQ